MTVGALLLAALRNVGTAVVTRTLADALLRFVRDAKIEKTVRQSFHAALRAHRTELHRHARPLPGDSTPAAFRIDEDAFHTLWNRDIVSPPSLSAPEELLPYVREFILIDGCDLSEEAHKDLLRRVLLTATSEFMRILPTRHPAFEQWAVGTLCLIEEGIDGLAEDHQAISAQLLRHHNDTLALFTALDSQRAADDLGAGTSDAPHWQNPLEEVTSEEMTYGEVRTYFVRRNAKLQTVRKHFGTMIEGQRGTGKTMLLKYLSFEVQIDEWRNDHDGKVDGFFSDPSNFLGVYCKLPQGVFDKSDLRDIPDPAHRIRVAEHRLVSHILYFVLGCAAKASEHRLIDGKKSERMARRLASLLARQGDGVPVSTHLEDVLVVGQDICRDEARRTDEYLGSFLPASQPVPFRPFLTFDSCLFPVLELLQEVLDARLPFFLLLDDYDVLDDYQQELVFSVAAKRDFHLVCMKYGVMREGRKTMRAGKNRTYRPGDDYDPVDLDWVDWGLQDAYRSTVLEIAERRLQIAHWACSFDDVFPTWQRGEELHREIMGQMCDEWEALPAEQRPCKSKSDYVHKYGNARYFQYLRQHRIRERYAGTSYIVDVSSGIIRQFLEQGKLMIDAARDRGWQPGGGEGISPEAQDNAARAYSTSFFDNINQTVGSTGELLDEESGVTSQEMARLVESLSDLFYARLHCANHGEPEIITVAIRGAIGERAHAILRVAVRESILHRFAYPPKTPGGPPLPAYMLNRRLAPRRGLSPRNMQGRIEITADDLLLAIDDRETFVTKFMPFVTGDILQPPLLPEEEAE